MNVRILLSTFGATLLVCSLQSHAQVAPSSTEVTHAPAWTPIKERDVLWRKRVWRTLDVHEKQNERFAATDPNGSINPILTVLLQGIKDGRVDAYSGDDDKFTTHLSYDDVLKKMGSSFNAKSVVRYNIKEDWLYDKVQKKMSVRIIGIAPVVEVKAAGGTPFQSLFWVPYFKTTEFLMLQNVANYAPNDGTTWYDVFEKKDFKSTIDKVSNSGPAPGLDVIK